MVRTYLNVQKDSVFAQSSSRGYFGNLQSMAYSAICHVLSIHREVMVGFWDDEDFREPAQEEGMTEDKG